MRMLIVGALVSGLATPATPVVAHDHLVSAALVKERLTVASQRRAQDLGALTAILSHPKVREALVSMQVDSEDLVAKASNLSDRDLRDLAERAARLEVDPAATGVGKALLIVFALVGVAFTVALIVCSSNGCV